MTRTTKHTLDFGPDYPTRPKFWFARALRVLSHYAGAQDVGALGVAILLEIVLSEDKRRYRSPPKWLKIRLSDRLGYSVDAISAAIDKCVDHGWLVWHQPHNRSRATAWMTIPAWADETVADEDSPAENMIGGDRPEKTVNHPGNDTVNRPGNGSVNGTVIHPGSYIPSPLPKPAPTPEDEWKAVRAAMIEIGIGETSEPLRSLKDNQVDPGLALGVLRYASEAKLWKPGKIRRRLINLLPGQSPDDRRHWMQPDHGPVHSQPPSSQATEESRTRDSRLRQLEVAFGPELNELTTAAMIERYPFPDHVRDRLRSYPTWKHTGRAPEVRRVVLEFLDAVQSNAPSS